MADKFQPDFYVTCATVIPVLFLAVTVQGRAWRVLLRAGWSFPILLRKQYEYHGSTADLIRRLPLVSVAGIILVGGGIGEFFALLALYWGSEFPGQRVIVFVATLILLAAVPLLTLAEAREEALRYLKRLDRQLGKDETADS